MLKGIKFVHPQKAEALDKFCKSGIESQQFYLFKFCNYTSHAY